MMRYYYIEYLLMTFKSTIVHLTIFKFLLSTVHFLCIKKMFEIIFKKSLFKSKIKKGFCLSIFEMQTYTLQIS
jgi:hypothetical protein